MYVLEILEKEKKHLELLQTEYSNRSNLKNIEWAIELIKKEEERKV